MTLSTCPKGRVWDAFVLGLPGVDVSSLSGHLATCPDCRILVADRRAYYSGLGGQERRFSSGAVVRPIPSTVTLTPLNLIELPVRTESVMAAAGPVEASTPVAATFASDDQRWMVKVVWDSSIGHVKLYVISSQGSPVAGLLIRLSGLATDYLTDAKGCVDLGSVRWPTEKSPQVTVTSPAATFSLDAAVMPEEKPSSTLVRSAHNDVLKVSVSQGEASCRLRVEIVALGPDLAGRPLRLAVKSAKNQQLLDLEPVMLLDNFELPTTLEIYLFP